MTQINSHPVSGIQSHDSIGKQVDDGPLEALDIKPTKQGNKPYISSGHLLTQLANMVKVMGISLLIGLPVGANPVLNGNLSVFNEASDRNR